MNNIKTIIYLLFAALTLAACEKDVTIDLPNYANEIVVEGNIEEGNIPIVILTKSQGYYSPINPAVFNDIFISDAEVKMVVNKTDTITFLRICTKETNGLPEEVKDLARALIGIPDTNVNICLYTRIDPRAIGKTGFTYDLIVNRGTEVLTSTTTIPAAVKLDSVYFKPISGIDSLSFIYANLTDPGTKGNAYRWFAQRINKYQSGMDSGEVKDPNYLAPFNSAFDDEFFNARSFEIAFNRGRFTGSEKEDDENGERGYYKVGDTILVKFATTDKPVYEYFRSYYNSIGSSGSPFASPANVKSNIVGGRGVWAGYGVSIDTAIFKAK